MRTLSWASLAALCLGPAAADEAGDVLSAVNAARAKAGCGALAVDKDLVAAARAHARAMATQDFFAHQGKDGSRLPERLARQGYRYRTAAENIAAGQDSARAVVRSWLQSPGHRRNILDCTMTETGIAWVYQADDAALPGTDSPLRHYWVQVFAVPE